MGSKTFGVGLRHMHIFLLDSSGLPMPADASATLIEGTMVEAVKTMTVNDPDPRRISHSGDDTLLAQDSLPALEAGSFDFTTSKTNLALDAMIEGGKVRTINSNNFRVGNSDNKGSEPQVMLVEYRQALDADPTSGSFGALRQWEARIYPSVRISKKSPSHEAENTDITYNATPTPVVNTPWNELFDETNWGATRGEYIENIIDYQPRWNFGRGDGTLTAFDLTHPPVDSNSLTVWVNGTLTTPSSVNTSSTNPAFTLSSAPAVGNLVAALIETLEPGNS